MIPNLKLISQTVACVLIGLYVHIANAQVEVPVEVRLNIPTAELIDEVYERQMTAAVDDPADLNELVKINFKEHPIFFEVANRMQPEQYRSFVKTRARLLKFAYWLLRPVTWNRQKLADRMASIDQFVIESADSIATSDRTGIVLSISGSLGLGLSQKLIEKIKSERLKSLIPESGGFYYVLASGLGIYVQANEAGKNRLVIDLFADVDRLQSIHTYAGEVSLAVNWGIAVDKSKGASVESLESHYVGILGVIRKSLDHFSYSLITGVALPPYLPVGMVYSNRTTRARVSILKVPWFRLRGDRCAEVFRESSPTDVVDANSHQVHF
ncbi:hypothetical protein BH10BDE1_BH10BDE1_05690 [soil metagenome]